MKRDRSIQAFIESLQAMAAHIPDGLDTDYFLIAEHDVIYSNCSTDQVPEDSDDGRKLLDNGWHVTDDHWAYFV